MKRLWLFLLLFCAVISGFSQPGLQTDTAYVQARSFNTFSLRQLKADKDFQYDKQQEPVQSLWDRFWKWFWWRIEELMKTREGKTTVWTVLILFGVCMIVFFVMKVLGMNRNALFGRSAHDHTRYSVEKEDIHSIPFDDAIAAAISGNDYRLATRLLYLQSLKKMSDKGFINWQINKTNTDYVREVANKNWQAAFINLTHSFEYTWYGEVYIGKDDFSEVHRQFLQFNNQNL